MVKKLSQLAKRLCVDPKDLTVGLQRHGGSWLLQRRVDGHRLNIVAKDPIDVWNRFAEAVTAQQEMMAEQQLTQDAGPLFDTVADAYRAKVEQMRGGTQRCYLAQIKKAQLRFGQMRMKEISHWDIKDWIDCMNCSASTAANIKIVMSQIYTLFFANYRDTYNPVRDVKLAAGKPKAKRMPPDTAVIEALKAHADEPEALPALLLLCTGCRIGEAIGLQRKDIDFAHHRIAVYKAAEWIGNHPHVTDTKTAAGVRIIPLVALLERQLLLLENLLAENYIIGGGAEPVTHTWYKKHWDSFWHSLGFAHETVTTVTRYHNGTAYKTANHYWCADVTAHQFRHAYVTMLCESGVPEAAAIQIVGHADRTMIHEVYYHISQQMITSAADKLNAALG